MIIMIRAKKFPIVIVLLGLVGLAGQSQGQAFATFKPGINLILPPAYNSLTDFWEAGYRLEGFIEMPFYAGDIRGGVHYVPYREKSGNSEIPDFKSFLYYIQWGEQVELPREFALSGALRLGVSTMLFEENSLYSGLLTESEFTAGLYGQLAYQFHPDWQIHLGGEYLGIFTRKRIRLFFISLGISRTFKSPRWLVELLR